MKKVLFATTALAGLAIGGVASAQGIALFGDARLGLGYNINNDGSTWVDSDGDTPDDLRAVSRVRFGVNMTGETDSGITFGATIRADNARGGEGSDPNGQTAGSVFVSGSWGTLTLGDTNGADEQWVGDVPGNYSLTGLADFNETKFISNGGDFGNDSGNSFASNADARPTVRYDFDVMGFGLSLSTNRELTDIGVGTGYSADFGGGSWTAGIGYYNYDSFDVDGGFETITVDGFDSDGNPVTAEVDGDPVTYSVGNGEQWSVGLSGEYESFGFGLTYVKINSDTNSFGKQEVDNLLVGASFGWDAWAVGVVYGNILSADGDGLDNIDGDDAWYITGQYDLGGGASINGGVGYTYGGIGDDGQDQATVADFGIKMAF